MKDSIQNHIKYFTDTMHNLIAIEKESHKFGTETEIPYAEIHILQAIGNNPDIHVTGLADFFGITKGAVSQFLMKLEKKGLITKSKASDNLSKLNLSLTEKGRIAYESHEIYHNSRYELMYKIFSNYTEGELDLIKRFISELNHEFKP